MNVERALSIRQPWADLILFGHKDVENRTWPVPSTVDLPLRIGVHASGRALTGDAYSAVVKRHLEIVGGRGSIILLGSTIRTGALLGYVTITGCHRAVDCSDVAGCSEGCGEFCSPWADPGDVWHWTLSDPVLLEVPRDMRGALGLWHLDAEVAR